MATKRNGVLSLVCILTVGSLITGSCTLPSSMNVAIDEGGNVTISLGGQETGDGTPPETVPTASTFEVGEITSRRELTTNEFLQAGEGDETFTDVYALATQEGYNEPRGGGEFMLSDGSRIHGLLLTSSDERMVVAFHFQLLDRSQSLLARVEDER